MERGIYEVISEVKIRREPRVVEGTTTNKVGLLKVGTRRKVYSTIVQKDNTTWGRVSESDAAGISEWCCIEGLNRVYMKFVEPLEEEPDTTTDMMVMKHEREIVHLEERVKRLEQIAGLAKGIRFDE